MTAQARMEALETALQAHVGAQWNVNRDAHVSLRTATDAELKAGIISLVSSELGSVSQEIFRGEPDEGNHQFTIICQKQLDEGAKGVDAENAEFAMFELLRSFVSRNDLPDPISRIFIKSAHQSQQAEVPYCWIVVNAEIELSN